MNRENEKPRFPFSDAELSADYLMTRYGHCDEAILGVLCLEEEACLIDDAIEIYRGEPVSVEPKRIFKEAIDRDAAAIILFHNHLDGNPEPSAGDILFTRHVNQTGKILGVRLVDHLILGSDGRWMSLARLGAVR